MPSISCVRRLVACCLVASASALAGPAAAAIVGTAGPPASPRSGVSHEATVTAPAVVRGPYLQRATPTGITVRWRTDVACPSRVDFGSAPGSLTAFVEDPTPTTEHVVVLDGLATGARYYYAVGDGTVVLAGDDAEHFFVTSPLPGAPWPTRIWVLGDSGTGDANAAAVRDAYYDFPGADATDLWLMLGDNAYPNGTDAEYQSKLFDIYPEMLRRSVLWPTMGNHDGVSSDSSTQSGPYYDSFTLPAAGESGGVNSGTEAYYAFDHANVHFVVLDSHESARNPGSPMLLWLEADLAATAQDWIIAYWHHPPYSKGSHDSDDPADSGGRLQEMRENVLPILEDHGVDLVLSGHSHSYERSFLLDGHYGDSSTLTGSMIVDGGDGNQSGDGVYWKPVPGPDPHQGTVYAVAGCSGSLAAGMLNHPAMHLSLSALGSLVLDVDNDRLDVRFLDNTGQVRDEFSIVKGCSGSPASFSSRNGGSDSHVFTPGLCDNGPPCYSDIASSVSSSLAGSFWRVGVGDPAIGVGFDNGTFEPLQPGSSGWINTGVPGDPAYIEGSWSLQEGVDGCLAVAGGADCMALTLADQDAGVGYFAGLAASADPSGDYLFAQPAGSPIVLAPIPRPSLLGSASVNPYTKNVDLVVNAPSGGLYDDGSGCGNGLVTGYRIYQQTVPRDAAAPVDRRIASGWTVAAGGELPSGDALPLGSPTTVTLTCYTAVDIYLASTLVFDSGFELPLVSRQPFYVLCSNCAKDDDQDGFCQQYISGMPGPDCDDADALVFPGAAQLCGDVANNDCSHPAWPALAGTNEGDDDGDGWTECSGDCDDSDPSAWHVPGAVQSLGFPNGNAMLEWSAPAAPGGTALRYDLLRSPVPTDYQGAGVCVAQDTMSTHAQDGDVPPPGTVYFYVGRAENLCGTGTLGVDSVGNPRIGASCP